MVSLESATAKALRSDLEAAARIVFPSERWKDDPVAFAAEVLGLEVWERQAEILRTVASSPRVAVTSGRKVGKSTSAAILALWWWATRPDARVVLIAPGARQVEEVLWREVRKLHARSGRCLACRIAEPRNRAPCAHSAPLGGKLGELPHTGLVAPDLRQIFGFASGNQERAAGISGAELMVIVDEASGVEQAMFDAMIGNLGGAVDPKLVLFSNPSRTTGTFYEAVAGKLKDSYARIHISSRETPNCVEGRIVIPGLATRQFVEDREREWGAESVLFKIHVEGDPIFSEQARIIPFDVIAEAQARWETASAVGRLFVGLDPAGKSDTGDETAFAARRGNKILELRVMRGAGTDKIIATARELMRTHSAGARAGGDSAPVLIVDTLGAVGAEVFGALRDDCNRSAGAYELVAVRGSNKASARNALIYDRVRDEAWAGFRSWLDNGGAIPSDPKLEAELHQPEWIPFGSQALVKVTDKDSLRVALGRSPDRADACVLSCYVPRRFLVDDARHEPPDDGANGDIYAENARLLGQGGTFDPYAAAMI